MDFVQRAFAAFFGALFVAAVAWVVLRWPGAPPPDDGDVSGWGTG